MHLSSSALLLMDIVTEVQATQGAIPATVPSFTSAASPAANTYQGEPMQTTSNAIAQWNTKLQELRQGGMSARDAVRQLVISNPVLHKAYLQASNAR